MDLNRTCESCGERFYQYRGRPAKRCSDCRGGDRYGPAHRAMRAATVDQAVGQQCARCGLPMLEGQAVELDHADNGDPNAYVGYSHARCNASAGAARGNRMRAAAYRAVKGLAPSANGVRTAAARLPVPEPRKCQRTREEITAEAQTTGKGLPCLCGGHSRCW